MFFDASVYKYYIRECRSSCAVYQSAWMPHLQPPCTRIPTSRRCLISCTTNCWLPLLLHDCDSSRHFGQDAAADILVALLKGMEEPPPILVNILGLLFPPEKTGQDSGSPIAGAMKNGFVHSLLRWMGVGSSSRKILMQDNMIVFSWTVVQFFVSSRPATPSSPMPPTTKPVMQCAMHTQSFLSIVKIALPANYAMSLSKNSAGESELDSSFEQMPGGDTDPDTWEADEKELLCFTKQDWEAGLHRKFSVLLLCEPNVSHCTNIQGTCSMQCSTCLCLWCAVAR